MSTPTTASTALPAPPSSTSSSSLLLRAGCVVCSEATLDSTFPLTIGAGSIVHPKACIQATHGPVSIGAGCILEEWAVVRCTAANPQGISVGDCSLIRVGAVIEGNVGEGCVIECRAQVGPQASVPPGCVIGPTIVLSDCSDMQSNTILYGSAAALNQTRRRREEQMQANMEEIKPRAQVLAEMLTKTHRILAVTK